MGPTESADSGRNLARFAAFVSLTVGLFVFAGWFLDLEQLTNIVPGWPRMPMLTAAAFMLAGVALWLLFYQRSLLGVLAAFALLVVPHIIGAPQPDSHESPIPESLHHSFVVAVVLTTLVYFALLGGLAGYFRDRFIRAS